jgi:phosphotransferase system  glucose/maltose/N-acetylglucosamine-specific IIC component
LKLYTTNYLILITLFFDIFNINHKKSFISELILNIICISIPKNNETWITIIHLTYFLAYFRFFFLKLKHKYFDAFSEDFMNMESGDGHDEHRNQLMKNVDFDNMYTIIEKEVQEYETD